MATATTRQVANLPSTVPAKRLSLADAIKGSRKLPSRLILHGQGGIGKTSWAVNAPNPFFMLSPGETGLHTLIDSGLAPEVPNLEVADWLGAMGVIDDLTTQEHGHKTLVIDVVDGLEKLCNQHVCQTDYQGDWSEKGFMGFYRGFRSVSSGPWRAFLASLDKLREAKRMAIVLLAHTGTATFKNPMGADFDHYAPEMYKDTWALTYGWADIVLFANREAVVKETKGQTKGKAQGSLARTMYTEWTPFADAKNRHNLPVEIDMGDSGAEAWHNFTEAIKAGRIASKEN